MDKWPYFVFASCKIRLSNTNGIKNPQPHPQAGLKNGLLFIQNASLDLSSYGKWNMTFASIFYSFVCFQLPIQTQQTGFRLDIYASKNKYKKGPQPCSLPYTRFRDFAQLVGNCAFSWSFENWNYYLVISKHSFALCSRNFQNVKLGLDFLEVW